MPTFDLTPLGLGDEGLCGTAMDSLVSELLCLFQGYKDIQICNMKADLSRYKEGSIYIIQLLNSNIMLAAWIHDLCSNQCSWIIKSELYIHKQKSITFERDDFSAACIYLDLTTVPDAND